MSDRIVYQDSIVPLPDQPGLTHQGLMVNAALPENRDESMTLLFSLALPADEQKKLEERVARGEVVPADELKEIFTPSAANREALVTWLKAQKFEIEDGPKDSTSVYARAPVSQIEKSLAVKMVRVTREGITYTAAQNAPSLPAKAGKGVHAIIGLQPFRHATKHSRMCTPYRGQRFAQAKKAGGKGRSSKKKSGPSRSAAAGPSTNVQNAPPYLVSEVLGAYNGTGLNVTGDGQTIAILIDTFPIDTDLKAFWTQNGVSTTMAQIAKINVGGGPMPAPEGEETLDASWTSGIAPDAKIRIYASGSLQFVDLDRAIDQIIADAPSQPGMRQVSISLGLGETFMGGPNGEVATQHSKFLHLSAMGINVFASSGDAGSNPDASGHSPTGPTQAEYEASDPNVIGVGGTSLTLNASGKVTGETGWTSGGGGKSILFPRQPWQVGAGMPAGQERLVPDVSAVADPDTGAFLVFHGQVTQIGGTSWSAPIWAGICALVNEARANAGKPFLPFLNPLIYPLLGTAAFRDITAGSNGAFSAKAGYDLVTGLGVPNIKELIRALT